MKHIAFNQEKLFRIRDIIEIILFRGKEKW